MTRFVRATFETYFTLIVRLEKKIWMSISMKVKALQLYMRLSVSDFIANLKVLKLIECNESNKFLIFTAEVLIVGQDSHFYNQKGIFVRIHAEYCLINPIWNARESLVPHRSSIKSAVAEFLPASLKCTLQSHDHIIVDLSCSIVKRVLL